MLDEVDLYRQPELQVPQKMGDSPLTLFYSYAHEDGPLRDQMETHLKILERRGLIAQRHDRLIPPGAKWAEEIDTNLTNADIILLLVSADFIASDYCYSKEMDAAMKRHEAGKACVIPVILRDVDMEGAPFAKLQGLPKDFKPVTQWTDRDSAWRNVAEGIKEAIESIRKKR